MPRELFKALKKLHNDEISEKVVEDKIKEATAHEISIAEQKLLEKGILDEEELKEFCEVHLKAVKQKTEQLKSDLPDAHPIKTLVLEHDEILDYLDQLEKIIDSLENSEIEEEDMEKLEHIAHHLVEAEKHHEREEEVIFPRLEDKGIDGPTRIMRADHDEYWPLKKEFKELVSKSSPSKLENKQRIIEISKTLVYGLRDHIFKENNILYPSALENLENWEEIREEGDEIGYCCFTPGYLE